MRSPQYRPCALIAHSVRRAQVEYGGGHVKQKMINNLVRLLQTDPGRVNVKARTHEKVEPSLHADCLPHRMRMTSLIAGTNP